MSANMRVESAERRFTTRLSGSAMRRLDALADEHKCTRRDVVEGLLFGSIRKIDRTPIRPTAHERQRIALRMSDEEFDIYLEGLG